MSKCEIITLWLIANLALLRKGNRMLSGETLGLKNVWA